MRTERDQETDRVKDGVGMGLAASSRVPSTLGPIARIFNLPFLAIIKVYRVLLSPFLGGQCRFEPTCSRYAAEAYRLHGPIAGSRMSMARICRCHPWNQGGFDPVPIPGHTQDPPLDPDPKDGASDTQEGESHGTTASGEKA